MTDIQIVRQALAATRVYARKAEHTRTSADDSAAKIARDALRDYLARQQPVRQVLNHNPLFVDMGGKHTGLRE
jgi:hypothetical protein